VFEGSGAYLLAAFVLTVLILGGYLWSLTSRARDAERDAARRQDPR
jgi:hypothetical protein